MKYQNQNKARHFARVYQLVAMIPYGKVATYKQLALLEGHITPRQAGYAMARCPAQYNGTPLAWHRVINSQGKVSPRSSGEHDSEQRQLLIEEGALSLDRATVDFSKVAWAGPEYQWLIDNNYFMAVGE